MNTCKSPKTNHIIYLVFLCILFLYVMGFAAGLYPKDQARPGRSYQTTNANTGADTSAVPEPSVALLGAVASMLLLRRRRERQDL